jgi:hypothetical protein
MKGLTLTPMNIIRRLIAVCVKNFPHKFQEQRQNAQAVTPASSGRSATKSGRKKTVELTPGQVAFAKKKMKIPLERYAKEVAKLERKKA